MDKYLSTKETAAALNISVRRVQVLCKSGRLGTLIGGRYLITDKDVKLFIRHPAGRPFAKNRKGV